jgi:hypothetical protein
MSEYSTGRRWDPQFPIYIPSKGRAGLAYTIRTLAKLGVPFHVVVEAQEVAAYRETLKYFDAGRLLVLDPAYQRGYDACMELPDDASRGPGPARNFAWDHAVSEYGAAWHWVMDDNIIDFWYYRTNMRWRAGDGAVLRLMEDFTTRYSNVAMAGPHYRYFVPRRANRAPFKINTRIYSCNLIRNDLPQRWRGRYNEDTILSLDLLKAGWCTIQFNAYLQDKLTTQLLPGGNTDEFYAREGTMPKSQMLVQEHPDVAKLVMRYGRPHHYVDYRPFANRRLILRPDAEPMVEPPITARHRNPPKPLLERQAQA